jgi:phosphopantetheine--protein transferase-like protein
MVIGVGTDILHISDISKDNLREEDPFLLATYSQKEITQANHRVIPYFYYATRFAGKEAVFKCFGISPEHIKLNEIVILDDENGQPHVSLTGRFAILAKEKNIGEILISLSHDNEYAIAFATAQSIDRK